MIGSTYTFFDTFFQKHHAGRQVLWPREALQINLTVNKAKRILEKLKFCYPTRLFVFAKAIR